GLTRITAMRNCGRSLLEAGIAVWTSGRSAAAKRVSTELCVPHNLWAATAPEVVKAAAEFTVTWAGPPPTEAADVAAHLVGLREAGAAGAAYAPPPSTNWA